ncbi:CHAP domain-containing protein [Pedosphaera parvula]|nr:CHAP domain-containing protein [Pedosphaera parvula]
MKLKILISTGTGMLGVAVAVLLAASAASVSAQSYTWGTTLVSGGTWMTGHGVNVFWNGTPNCNPNYVGGNSYTTYNGTQYYTGEQYQCGELPFRLYTTLGWYLGAWPDTYAYQMYTSPPAGMQTHANGSGYVPVPGDCVVWNTAATTDTAGHVAVVNYVDGGHVYICEQNMCNYGTAILNRSGSNGSTLARADGWGAGALLGCVHSPNNPNTYINTHINPCVARTSDGRLELFAVDLSGNMTHNYQTSPGGSWAGWTLLGTASNLFATNSFPAVGVNADGRLELFAVASSGVINHIWQKVAGSSAATNWSSFTAFSSSVSPTAKLAVGNWANGVQDLFVIGTDGVLYHNYQTAPNSGWAGFVSLGGSWQQDGDIAVGRENDGRVEVFVIGNTGNLYHNWETAANGTSWNGWANIGGALAEQVRVAVGRNSDGRLEVFTLGTDGVCYHEWETTANTPGTWSSWGSLGGLWKVDAKPFVGTDSNGALEVFLIGSTGNLYHNYQSGGGWSGWLSLTGSFTQNVRPCVGMNQSGKLEVFLTGPSADVQTATESAANSATWSAFSSLGGSWN